MGQSHTASGIQNTFPFDLQNCYCHYLTTFKQSRERPSSSSAGKNVESLKQTHLEIRGFVKKQQSATYLSINS